MDKKDRLHKERHLTDESLEAERERTDDELTKRRATVEEDADSVVRLARSRADALLDRARELTGEQPTTHAPEVAEERRHADEKLGAERALADTALTFERDDHRRVLQEALRVERQATDARGEIRFSVSDTGPGIPADKLETIFDRFVQVDDPATRRGLGLGLHIAKSIVEAHHGTIHVEIAAGRGSTFVFTLPAAV